MRFETKENARPVAPTTGQAVGTVQHIFQLDFNPLAAGNQLGISSFLRPGQENSVSLTQLQQWTGLDKRVIRQRIAAERFMGVPILADNKTGYFLPATEEERKRCVQSMRHRAKEIYKAAEAIETADISASVPSTPPPGCGGRGADSG